MMYIHTSCGAAGFFERWSQFGQAFEGSPRPDPIILCDSNSALSVVFIHKFSSDWCDFLIKQALFLCHGCPNVIKVHK